ncbi:glycine cleavage system aminomethyltransferase GcvT [Candidatus Nitrospira bockiana]
MKRTPLFEAHRTAGGRLVDFAGWEMPIQYSGVVDEYRAVRQAAGLFDVSHMGRIEVRGSGGVPFLQRVTTNDVATLAVLASHYSMVCNAEGGIKDDIFVYRLDSDTFLLCVNASNREKILRWLDEQRRGAAQVELIDRSAVWAQMALQGPASRDILLRLGVGEVAALKPRHCASVSMLGERVWITRTGYTGELGYELYCPAAISLDLWQAVLDAGKPSGVKPAGLGARDLLRLDMGYLLYGNDITEETTPLEAGADWIVSLTKGPFIGREALLRQRQHGLQRRLVAFELVEKGVPRHGCRILASQGGPVIGEVTSGNLSPHLQKGIGLGYVPPEQASVGASLVIDLRGKPLPAVVVKPPFYRRPSA